MKKTLVALAVLAASGASFAQVALTGYFEYHYRASTSDAGNSTGFGTDGSELFFNATDDLGGGLKATASMGIAGADRSSESGNFNGTGQNSAVIGLDGFMTLGSDSLGTFKFATTQPGDYLSGGVAGVAGYSLDGQLFDGLSNRDSVGYSKSFGAFTGSYTYYEAAKVVGEGNGTSGAAAEALGAQRKNSFGLTYAAGPIVANASYGAYDHQGDGSAASGAVNIKSVYDISGSYDFGAVKLGLGTEKKTFVVGDRTDILVGLSIPLGSLTLGAQYATRTFNGVNKGTSVGTNVAADANGGGTVNETALTAKYALSKRTYVGAKSVSYDTSAAGTTGKNTQTDIYIGTSF